MKKIASAAGSTPCKNEGCNIYTKKPSGYCSICERTSLLTTKCAICHGFSGNGARTYCPRHLHIFAKGKLLFQHDISTRLASFLLDARENDKVYQIKYAGSGNIINSRILQGKELAITETATDAAEAAFGRLFQAITAFDRELDRILTHETPIESATEVEITTDGETTTIELTDCAPSESEASERGRTSTAGSSHSESEPSDSEADVPHDA